MEKIFEDANIKAEIKRKKIVLSGETEKLRPEFTNLGGKELRSGKWSFPLDMEAALTQAVLNLERADIRLDSENMPTEEVLEVCRADNLALNVNNRDSCIKAADETKPYIDPEEIAERIVLELEKMKNLDSADPKIVYDVVASYFGQDIAPLYETYLPIYQKELEELKSSRGEEGVELAFLHTYDGDEIISFCKNFGLSFENGNVESCKVALMSNDSPLGRELRENIRRVMGPGKDVLGEIGKIYGKEFSEENHSFLVDVIDEETGIEEEKDVPTLPALSFPKPTKPKKVVVAQRKPKRQRPKDPLKLNKATQDLFDRIVGNLLAMPPEEGERKGLVFYTEVKDLLKQQETENDRDFSIRKLITQKIDRADLGFSPDKVVLLGYLFAKKMLYGVGYDDFVEIQLQEIKDRI